MKLFTLVFAALAALLSVPAPAAELMKLDIDFGHPAWRGVVTPLWGGLPEVERNGNTAALAFGPGSFCGTPLIPCPPGSVVEIAFDASATAIAPGGEAWRTAAVQLGLFDGTAEQSHLDLFNTGRATPFRRYESRTPVSGNGFRLCFGNYGRSGTFRIANLLIRIMVPGRNVERDGSFSGMFGINDWFVQKGGVDWDGLGLGSFEHAKVVKNAFPGAGSTLELDGGATVVSRQFPYNGEGLVVGGWFRQAGIARPEDGRPWAHAGIQLVFFDRDDNVIGHDDVTRQLLPGDRPWGYHVIEISPGGLSPKVKSVALYLRIWGGTAGKAWFDELAVVKQGEGQARNYDSSKGVIAVGPAGEAAELVRVWNGVDLSYCSQIDLPQVRTALRRLKEEGGLEYLRTREFFNGPFPVKSIDAAGNMTYDFSTVDKYLDYPVKELGLKLVPTIETVPPQLRRDSDGHVPKDFALWGRAVKALVRHWIGRYGREEVSQWVFECWNEPGSDFFRGTDEEFCRLFVAYLEALTGVEKECGIKLRIGTPSGANGFFATDLSVRRDEQPAVAGDGGGPPGRARRRGDRCEHPYLRRLRGGDGALPHRHRRCPQAHGAVSCRARRAGSRDRIQRLRHGKPPLRHPDRGGVRGQGEPPDGRRRGAAHLFLLRDRPPVSESRTPLFDRPRLHDPL